MRKFLMAALVAAAGLSTTSFVAPAAASELGPVRSYLDEGPAVLAPRGFQNLCASRPEFCVNQRVEPGVSRILEQMGSRYGNGSLHTDAPELTPERLRVLDQVNLTVNASIFPTEDTGGDIWSFSALAGDCEEYVLMKREVLARLGWPRSAMRISVVRGAGDYPYHAVLVVATRGGEFVLDNLSDKLTRVQDSPYEFVVSQSFQRPGAWVRVRAAQQ